MTMTSPRNMKMGQAALAAHDLENLAPRFRRPRLMAENASIESPEKAVTPAQIIEMNVVRIAEQIERQPPVLLLHQRHHWQVRLENMAVT